MHIAASKPMIKKKDIKSNIVEKEIIKEELKNI